MPEVYKNIAFSLPTSVKPEDFGSAYWQAFNKLASELPCTSCRAEAISFVNFWHDLKNQDLGKPIYDKQNFDAWILKICYDAAEKRNIQKENNYRLIGNVLSVVLILMGVISIFRK